MADINATLNKILQIDGAMACALVDYETGMTLGTASNTNFPIELAAAANTDVVRAKQRAMQSLGLRDTIDDILITLSTQYHMIRPLSKHRSLFLYVALQRPAANLALSRLKLTEAEGGLVLPL
ncbi:MAG: hypothetical protein JNK72_04880 [Myxococcales bacterium]|nr:hypothetical protein [Myxococcales bacterium]